MFISYSTKEETVNNDIELIHVVNIVINEEKYHYESLTPITVKEVKKKIRTIENLNKFERGWDS